jgi:hypothetical protein
MYRIQITLNESGFTAIKTAHDVLYAMPSLVDLCTIDYQTVSTVIIARYFIKPSVWQARNDKEREEGATQLIRTLVSEFGKHWPTMPIVNSVTVRYDAQHPPFTREVTTLEGAP